LALSRHGNFVQEIAIMMKRVALLSLLVVGAAGAAQAQTVIYRAAPAPAQTVIVQPSEPAPRYQALTMDHTPSITDEYGMRYNSRGDRLDARGNIMPPPVTPPGVAAYR
jgi:hypothetical protein